MIDITPWKGIFPFVNDLWIILPTLTYFIGRNRAGHRRRLTP